ncbi:MAG: hypothetical protein ACI8VC_001096 [Candidatus Endobugula sp.]|jgi:hypothetical protein
MQLSLSEYGFKSVQGYEDKIPECICLLKRQNINTNRAICVVQLSEKPKDIGAYIINLRNRVAFKVGFFPLLWGLGLQVIILCPSTTNGSLLPKDYVATVDNQWAIVQSVFFVDAKKNEFIEGRTWGQLITGKFQDAISKELQANYENVST